MRRPEEPFAEATLPRERLFRQFDQAVRRPVVWVSGPAGSGKTTLASTYLDTHNIPSLWYKIDKNDSDLASFFYHMGIAAKRANPRKKRPLPLLTPE